MVVFAPILFVDMFRHHIVSSARADIVETERMGMAIIEWPKNKAAEMTVACVVCRQNVPFLNATIGIWDTQNKQSFACNTHLTRGASTLFLRAWAVVRSEERADKS